MGGSLKASTQRTCKRPRRCWMNSKARQPSPAQLWSEKECAMTLRELLVDIHALEEDLLAFERKYGIRSETFYAAYASGEEPENDQWTLDFAEWAGVYRTWLTRQAEYRNEVQRLQRNLPSLAGLIQV